MSGRTDTERYDQALAYIKTNVSADIGLLIDAKAGGKKKQIGAALSLSGYGMKNVGSKNQHMALRGLLMCQNVLLDPKAYEHPVGNKHAKNYLGKNCRNTVEHFKNLGEADICKAIQSYGRLPNVSLKQFAQAARDLTNMGGDFNLCSVTREQTTNFGGTTNCYGAVKIWLFKSGLCSLMWLLEEGDKLNAYSCNQIIGNGDIVTEDNIDNIPEGKIFNIHDSADPAICHWGVCLGGGMAAASNTTAGGMTKGGAVFVDFTPPGNTAYGLFKLQSSVDVCKAVYNSHKVVLRVTDPLASVAYY